MLCTALHRHLIDRALCDRFQNLKKLENTVVFPSFLTVINHARIHTRTTPFLHALVYLAPTPYVIAISIFQLIGMSTETSPKNTRRLYSLTLAVW